MKSKSGLPWVELLTVALLIGLPLAGILFQGLPIMRCLEFPPQTHYVEHSGFSWPVFIGLAGLILAAITPFIIRILFPRHCATVTTLDGQGRDASPRHPARASPEVSPRQVCGRLGEPSLPFLEIPILEHNSQAEIQLRPAAQRRFPIWGWAGIAFGILAWILAWTRFSWFAGLQAFTFSPLWFAYIVTVNALTWRRTGQCMLTNRTRYFLVLFPVSALFWWIFEYFNRFVQNWYYLGIGSLTPGAYFIFATLPFATVLPAVMGTCDLLATFPRFCAGLINVIPVPHLRPWRVAGIILIISATGLAAIGVWPDYLFPLLWLSPLGVLAALLTLTGRSTLFTAFARGDQRRFVLLALSALICGFFWEMWNYYSLAKWVYAVPFVNRFHIFEMPLLGYAGYLPFGLECAVIADRIAEWCERPASLKVTTCGIN